MQRPLFALLLAAADAAHAAPHRQACAPTTSAERDVVTTVQAIFAAAKADDMTAFHAVTTPDFYAYDNGEALAGDALMKLIAQAHAAGKKYEWSVTAPRVHLSCDTAWISYVNRGSYEDAAGKKELAWLESANLQYDGTRWLIRFVHSTRAAQPPAS